MYLVFNKADKAKKFLDVWLFLASVVAELASVIAVPELGGLHQYWF